LCAHLVWAVSIELMAMQLAPSMQSGLASLGGRLVSIYSDGFSQKQQPYAIGAAVHEATVPVHNSCVGSARAWLWGATAALGLACRSSHRSARRSASRSALPSNRFVTLPRGLTGSAPEEVRGQAVVRGDGGVVAESVSLKDAALTMWTLEEHGFTIVPLPVENACDLALAAGRDIIEGPQHQWQPIRNGDDNLGRRQAFLLNHRALGGLWKTVSSNTSAIMTAAREVVQNMLGPDMLLNDPVIIADFDKNMTRQELHRDIEREDVTSTTHGMLVPLAPGACLHIVPGSHKSRGNLAGTFSRQEVLRIEVRPGFALLWDGMLVHAGDGASPDASSDAPNRPRLHLYPEHESEERPINHAGDRSIVETD